MTDPYPLQPSATILTFTLLLALAHPPIHAHSETPATEITTALSDLTKNVPPTSRASTRYLSQYNAPRSTWKQNTAVLSFVLNSISRATSIVFPANVPSTEGRLLRIDLAAYRLPPKTWESLVSDREPYWHITTQVAIPTTSKKKPVKTVYTDGGWLDLNQAAALRLHTRSGGAVVRLDWFIAKVTTPPHYYRFAGIPSTATAWYKSLGVEKKTIIALGANQGANLFYSQVTQKTRRISRYQGPLGGVWQTYDNFGDDPGKDPFRNPTFSTPYDAVEAIAAGSNGLHRFAIFDQRGRRQDVVPDRIAKDDSDPQSDGRLVPMISCVRCHIEDGLRPFANDQRRLLAGKVQLLTDNPKTADQLTAFYTSPKLARGLRRDREDYAAALHQATAGMTTRELVTALATIYRNYNHQLVTPESAQAELGITSLDLLRPSHDPILLALLSGIPVQRKQFEASFPEAALLTKPLPSTPQVKTP